MRVPKPHRLFAIRSLCRPVFILPLLIVAQWGAVGVFALVVRHNGWLFFQGGDQTFYYTSSWELTRARIPEAEIGYAWSYLISPLALAVGPNYLLALPGVVLFQVLLLLPIALCCVYAITARIGGRLLGYTAVALWIAVPFALIPLFEQRYHERYVEQLLPQAFGLSGLGDFPSMVCLLVAALFCLRALDRADLIDGGLAGLAAGFAIGIKPANALFLAGPALAFLVARRLREAASFTAALLPPLIALALWKYRGLGHLPIVSSTATSAAGANPALATSVSQYLDLDWSRLRDNYTQLREFLPAAPFLQALPLAGAIAALWRSPPKALLLAGWVGAFLVVKGSSDQASIESGTLLRLFMPGFPPLLMLSALVPLLVLSPRRLRAEAPPESASVGARAVGAALVVFGLLPLLLFLVFSPLHDRTAVKYFAQNVMVPVDRSFTVTVSRGGGGELVEWKPQQSPGVRRFYRVFRVRPRRSAPDPTLPAGRDGIRCLDASASPHDRAADCRLEMKYVGSTRMSRFVDKPPAGPWTYRVGLAANWRDDVTIGDVLLLSAPGRLSALH